MPSHTEQIIVPYTPEQMFALVSDVAAYPEFLPWCRAARISEVREHRFLGELVIAYKGFSESYLSEVRLTPYSAIDVVMIEGPFKYLTNQWRFRPHIEGACVDFVLDFEFRSKLLDTLMGTFFTRATEKMAGAFQDRAKALYGND